MSYINNVKTISTVISTGLLPMTDVVIFGNNNISMTGTIQTSKMIIGQTIFIKRNTDSTGNLNIKGESGQIQNLNNTLSATTTLANGTSSTGKNILFVWDGTNLLRLLNG